MTHQPSLHNLSGVFAAPLQAWAAPDGQIRGSGAQGIYFSDQRIICEAVVSVNAAEPEWVSAQTAGADSVSYLSFIRTDSAVADPLVSLRRARSATGMRLTESFELFSALDKATDFTVQVRLTADNSALETIKQGRASVEPALASAVGWKWHDDNACLTLSFDGPAQVTADAATVTATWHIKVLPGGTALFGWTLAVHDAGAPMTAPVSAPLSAPKVEDPAVSQLLKRAVSDLNGLRLTDRLSPSDTFLAAGAPWFFTMFGRDALIAARMLLPIDTMIARGTLRTLARRQGTKTDVETAEQPGKILHEVRRGTTAYTLDGTLTLPPVYFGTIDATLLWILLLRDTWRAGMPEKEVRALMPNLERGLAWLRDHGDADGDGFLEYFDATGHGLANQGWKDSGDSIRWHDGRLADGPIALCEIQGYAYAAALAGAELLDAFGREQNLSGSTPEQWRAYAKNLGHQFRTNFWCNDEDGPYPAIALDAAKEPVDGVASNMGHLLGTGILDTEETAAVIRRLMDPTMFSGYGIRTISTTNAAYWPTRYHAGSVWTHDTAMILSGLLAEGHGAEAGLLADGLLAAARGFEWRLPELFAGYGAAQASPPVPYPASCRPQAWAAASAVPIAQALGQLPAQPGKLRSTSTSRNSAGILA
jgi:glycogen debranching enzyme